MGLTVKLKDIKELLKDGKAEPELLKMLMLYWV
jgi:hypothetical protein